MNNEELRKLFYNKLNIGYTPGEIQGEDLYLKEEENTLFEDDKNKYTDPDLYNKDITLAKLKQLDDVLNEFDNKLDEYHTANWKNIPIDISDPKLLDAMIGIFNDPAKKEITWDNYKDLLDLIDEYEHVDVNAETGIDDILNTDLTKNQSINSEDKISEPFNDPDSQQNIRRLATQNNQNNPNKTVQSYASYEDNNENFDIPRSEQKAYRYSEQYQWLIIVIIMIIRFFLVKFVARFLLRIPSLNIPTGLTIIPMGVILSMVVKFIVDKFINYVTKTILRGVTPEQLKEKINKIKSSRGFDNAMFKKQKKRITSMPPSNIGKHEHDNVYKNAKTIVNEVDKEKNKSRNKSKVEPSHKYKDLINKAKTSVFNDVTIIATPGDDKWKNEYNKLESKKTKQLPNNSIKNIGTNISNTNAGNSITEASTFTFNTLKPLVTKLPSKIFQKVFNEEDNLDFKNHKVKSTIQALSNPLTEIDSLGSDSIVDVKNSTLKFVNDKILNPFDDLKDESKAIWSNLGTVWKNNKWGTGKESSDELIDNNIKTAQYKSKQVTDDINNILSSAGVVSKMDVDNNINKINKKLNQSNLTPQQKYKLLQEKQQWNNIKDKIDTLKNEKNIYDQQLKDINQYKNNKNSLLHKANDFVNNVENVAYAISATIDTSIQQFQSLLKTIFGKSDQQNLCCLVDIILGESKARDDTSKKKEIEKAKKKLRNWKKALSLLVGGYKDDLNGIFDILTMLYDQLKQKAINYIIAIINKIFKEVLDKINKEVERFFSKNNKSLKNCTPLNELIQMYITLIKKFQQKLIKYVKAKLNINLKFKKRLDLMINIEGGNAKLKKIIALIDSIIKLLDLAGSCLTYTEAQSVLDNGAAAAGALTVEGEKNFNKNVNDSIIYITSLGIINWKVTAPDWITLNGKTTGQGTYDLHITLSENTTGSERVGLIKVNDISFYITQSPTDISNTQTQHAISKVMGIDNKKLNKDILTNAGLSKEQLDKFVNITTGKYTPTGDELLDMIKVIKANDIINSPGNNKEINEILPSVKLSSDEINNYKALLLTSIDDTSNENMLTNSLGLVYLESIITNDKIKSSVREHRLFRCCFTDYTI